MKKLHPLTIVGITSLALIGALKVFQTACDLTAIALACWGGWDIAEAAQAAPVILAAAAGGLVLACKAMLDDDAYTDEPERRDP